MSSHELEGNITRHEAEARAELIGYHDREWVSRGTQTPNHQLTLDELEGRVIEVLVAARWRGWSRADDVPRRNQRD